MASGHKQGSPSTRLGAGRQQGNSPQHANGGRAAAALLTIACTLAGAAVIAVASGVTDVKVQAAALAQQARQIEQLDARQQADRTAMEIRLREEIAPLRQELGETKGDIREIKAILQRIEKQGTR